jgi:hypothetical protein
MNPEVENHIIFSNNEALKISNKYEVRNVCDFNNGRELLSFFDGNISEQRKILNLSIPISLAVTSYARILMSQFKTMKNINLYYTDTDSIDIDKPLDEIIIGKELGKMKLEHVFDKAIFLAPKVYGGISSDYEYIKVKGYKIKDKFTGIKNPLNLNDFKSLLYKNNKLEIKQEKLYRNNSKGHIENKDEIYTLVVTDKKEKLYMIIIINS